MDRFKPKSDKGKAMTEVVSYHGVAPLERGLCYCLYLVGKHWDDYDDSFIPILSAARDERYIAAHNREFKTNLHSQPWLVKKHEEDPVHYAPANAPNATAHCLRSDGNLVYKDRRGRYITRYGWLLWYFRGIDLKTNAMGAEFCRRAQELGLPFVQPYKAGSELHHVCCTTSPIKVLVDHRVIYKR